jgi:hypothetical protein
MMENVPAIKTPTAEAALNEAAPNRKRGYDYCKIDREDARCCAHFLALI